MTYRFMKKINLVMAIADKDIKQSGTPFIWRIAIATFHMDYPFK
jgi:hypothetical protein